MIQAPATTRSAISAGAMASTRLTDATAAVAAANPWLAIGPGVIAFLVVFGAWCMAPRARNA